MNRPIGTIFALIQVPAVFLEFQDHKLVGAKNSTPRNGYCQTTRQKRDALRMTISVWEGEK